MKRLFFKIYLFFHYLFSGLHSADRIVGGSGKRDGEVDFGVEEQDEEQSVYNDLLRGEVTQEVKELRHEMYHAERASHRYEYMGGGLARERKNDFFDFSGNLDCGDGLDIVLIQPNRVDNGMSTDIGYQMDLHNKEFLIKIGRDGFMPRFRIEEFTDKLVLKRDGDGYVIDLYVQRYQSQFDRIQKLFVKEMDGIYGGNSRSDILEISSLSFVTTKAYGVKSYNVDNMKEYEFKDLAYMGTNVFEGNYVVKFKATAVKDGYDIVLNEFTDKKAEDKFERKEKRKGKDTYDPNAVPVLPWETIMNGGTAVKTQ